MPLSQPNEHQEHAFLIGATHRNSQAAGEAEALALRRDMVTLLTYARDTKVVGTASTGNMPLKAVGEVIARFVEPLRLEHNVGKHVHRVRSEAEVWPLYFLHILAAVGGLLLAKPARRWRLGRSGEHFLNSAPLSQVVFLLATWWYEVNWLVTCPWEGIGEYLPGSFKRVTLARLRSLAVEESIPFEGFADALVEETGLTWGSGNKENKYAADLLRVSVSRMLVDVL
ncbi:MAG: hypothetical protein ABIF82_05035, partial [Planctomycetota bacterium]